MASSLLLLPSSGQTRMHASSQILRSSLHAHSEGPVARSQVLGQGAVHGAFAGYTGFTVGLVNTHYVYLPIPVIIQVRGVVICHSEQVVRRVKIRTPRQSGRGSDLRFFHALTVSVGG